MPNTPVNDIDFDKEGNAWIGTDSGLVMFDGQNWTLYDSTNSGLRYNKVNAVKVCKYGNIWVGYEYIKNYRNNFGGLVKFDHTVWKDYNISSTVINEKNIYSMIDKENELWVSAGGYIYTRKNDRFERFITPYDSLSYSGLYILGEHNGEKWFNDYGKAIIKYDGENWTVFDTTSSKIFNYTVSEMTFDKEGNPWITTYGGGIAKYDGSEWIIIDTSNSGIEYQWLADIEFDKEGIMWLASYKGLMKYDGENWELFTKENSGLITNYVLRIFIDEKNNKWIGSYEGGIYKYDGENWTVYTIDNSDLYDDRIRDIKMDSNNYIWIATAYGGIAKLENEEWTVYRRGTSGLQSDMINSIDFDQIGNLWVATNEGLALFKDAGTSVNEPESQVKGIINYPNPFSSSTTISYELEQAGYVSIRVFDSFGKEISTLVNKTMQAGSHTAEFNSAGLSSGTYYYTIKANNKTESGKFVIVK